MTPDPPNITGYRAGQHQNAPNRITLGAMTAFDSDRPGAKPRTVSHKRGRTLRKRRGRALSMGLGAQV